MGILWALVSDIRKTLKHVNEAHSQRFSTSFWQLHICVLNTDLTALVGCIHHILHSSGSHWVS